MNLATILLILILILICFGILLYHTIDREMELNQIILERDQALQQIPSLEGEIYQLQDGLGTCTQENYLQQQENSTLRSDLNTCQQTKDNLSTELAGCQAKVTNLEQEKAALQSQNNQASQRPEPQGWMELSLTNLANWASATLFLMLLAVILTLEISKRQTAKQRSATWPTLRGAKPTILIKVTREELEQIIQNRRRQ